jgi:hypothetical protein
MIVLGVFILIALIFAARKVYINHLISMKISKYLDRKINSMYRKPVNEAINKFWPELSLKERTDFLQYCGMNIGTSWQEGILEGNDINEIRAEVKKYKDKLEKLDNDDNI